MSRGVLYVHSATTALCPHVEWALSSVMQTRVTLPWTDQPAISGAQRAELSWSAPPGTSARIASALRGWEHLRFEVTEEPSAGSEGARFSYAPSLGLYHATIGVNGDIMLSENRLRAAMLHAAEGDTDLQAELDQLLGRPWDEELEPFRHAGEGAPVRWLHRVG
jgi:hypothetical protein